MSTYSISTRGKTRTMLPRQTKQRAKRNKLTMVPHPRALQRI